MKKQLLLLFFAFLFPLLSLAQTNPLSVNTTLYSPSQLVSQVLIQNPCLEISNVASVTGTNFGQSNGIGFFQNTNPNFPLASGIVLSTGDVSHAPGPNSSVLSDGSYAWTGDAQLEQFIGAAIGAPLASYNATSLEFDFTALNEFMSFNFLFASEEYGTFQCTYADAFAFLLTDLETGVTTNLAVVPSTSAPVSVVTIRDSQYNSGCSSVNEGYFGDYFGQGDTVSATNFIGQTSVMTASSALVANHPYHIKLVVADRSDPAYDSAVFIQAGSFTMGPPQCSDKIRLVAFVDANANGLKDTGEAPFDHGSFSIVKNNEAVPDFAYSPFGSYDLYDANPANVYDLSFAIQPEYAAYYSTSASYAELSIATGSGEQFAYFPIILTNAFTDVAVNIVSTTPPRPGLTYENKVVYTNNGVAPASGVLQFAKDANTIISTVSQSGTTATANGFSYAYSNLLPNESRSLTVTLSVPEPPAVNLGDELTNVASISAGSNDVNTPNNSFSDSQVVVNSYDPNMVVEAHGTQIDINTFSSNEYLYYTVYFQNVGTASAIRVRIDDILDAKLDETTLVQLNSSHNCTLIRKGKALHWVFDYIMLPGQMENDALSKGYVFFKIKTKPGIQAGDVIANKANIVFDSNAPIMTNTFYTTFVNALSTPDFSQHDLVIFPNPAKDSFTVNSSDSSDPISRVSVYDMLGKKIFDVKVDQSAQANVSVSGWSKGVYLTEVTTQENRKLVRKVVVE